MMVAALSLGRVAILAVVLWLALLIYTSTVLVNVHKSSKGGDESMEKMKKEEDDLNKRLVDALSDIQLLRRQNEELKELLIIRNATSTSVASFARDVALSREHQTLRRSIENGIVELWYAASSKLANLRQKVKGQPDTVRAVHQLTNELAEQHRSILADAFKFSQADGVERQRRQLLWNLTRIVQNRIAYLQNPLDCQNARKLICHLNKGCGFGCQLHHVTYCLMVAYGTQRTMVLDSRGWRYSQRGWDSIFLPVSQTCRNFSETLNVETWKGEDVQAGVQVISLPIVDGIYPRPAYLPLSFPEEFADKLLALHGNPPVWWAGQFVWYLMRYQDEFKSELSGMTKRLNFSSPCVGIHVRRTDKVGSEAAFHALDEYMQFVETWYRMEATKNGSVSFNSMTKRVYLATDEPSLFAQAKEKYGEYTFVGDSQVSNTAQLSSRYSDSSLRGVVADIHFLSRCDYIVCTFSSQVCRVAYEIMQVLRGDAASRFHSLDDIYYFGGQEAHEQIAILPHRAASADEVDLETGDVVGIAGNHWDGYSKGKNYRTGQIGLYPSYKTREKWRIVKFPTYPEADTSGRSK